MSSSSLGSASSAVDESSESSDDLETEDSSPSGDEQVWDEIYVLYSNLNHFIEFWAIFWLEGCCR